MDDTPPRETALAALAQFAKRGTEPLDIAHGALVLAMLGRPRVPLERYRAHLAELAADLSAAARLAQGIEGAVNALTATLFDRHGYAGDTETYDDLQNANLMRVIDRKRGLPVALGILAIHAARAQGWEGVGLNFPGHFLVRIGRDSQRAIIDPFNRGKMLAADELRALLRSMAGEDARLEPGHYAALADRDVLLRLQNNIKVRQLQAGAVEEALKCLEAMIALAPDKGELWREQGLLHARTGNLRAAQGALERFLTLDPSDTERHRIAAVLQEIKGRLN